MTFRNHARLNTYTNALYILSTRLEFKGGMRQVKINLDLTYVTLPLSYDFYNQKINTPAYLRRILLLIFVAN